MHPSFFSNSLQLETIISFWWTLLILLDVLFYKLRVLLLVDLTLLAYTHDRRTVKNIPKYAPAQFYIDNVLPRVKEKKIMALKPFVDRLGWVVCFNWCVSYIFPTHNHVHQGQYICQCWLNLSFLFTRYDNVPQEINRLRCRVNYHALKFLPEIENMADLLVSRMRNRTGSANPFM